MLTTNRTVFIRFLKAYLSLAAMIGFVLAVSLVKGAGWKVVLVGMPLFLVFFVGISYQLIKELRALKREKSQEPE